ncbi:MAG: aldehyde dehydrogenase family protein [Synergistaceae bacterium]|nr:aldehyde dehydrogenase family protein [Synergistaceae bacterium]
MFIDGRRVEASDNGVIEVRNSATGEFIDTVPAATPQDVEAALVAARRGKKSWGIVPVHERARILMKCADAIDAKREELAVSLSTEMGKIIREARPEIRVCAQILRGYAGMASHHFGHTLNEYQIGAENDVIFTRREPLGVVACISPFNYPVELCAQKFASALAAGNAVVIKPASDNPLTIMKVVELCLECGVPGNALQLVTGRGASVGDALAKSPLVDAVSLTGSTEVGIRVAEAGAKTLKRVCLELGGNDPYIVFDDADMETAIRDAVAGRVQNAGQTCCAPKRFFVQKGVHDEFVRGAVEMIKSLKTGSPLDESTDLGSLISGRAAAEVQRQVDHTIKQGARLVCGGHVYGETYFEPTVLDGVTMEMDVAREMEIFGPVMPVIEFETEEQAVEMANATPYGLQAGVITRDMGLAMRVAARLECGGVVFNSSGNYRHLQQPFGGWKQTGIGQEGVSRTLDEMTLEKSYILKNILKAPE